MCPLILLLITHIGVQCIALLADLDLLVRKGSVELQIHLVRDLRNLRMTGDPYQIGIPSLATGNMIFPTYFMQTLHLVLPF